MKLLTLSLSALTIVACTILLSGYVSAAPAPSTAIPTDCQGALAIARQYGSVTGVVAGELTNAADVAAWQENRDAPVFRPDSIFRSLSASVPVAVCVYSGQFNAPMGPGGGSALSDPYDRLTLIVFSDGSEVLDSASHSSISRPRTPSAWRTATGH